MVIILLCFAVSTRSKCVANVSNSLLLDYKYLKLTQYVLSILMSYVVRIVCKNHVIYTKRGNLIVRYFLMPPLHIFIHTSSGNQCHGVIHTTAEFIRRMEGAPIYGPLSSDVRPENRQQDNRAPPWAIVASPSTKALRSLHYRPSCGGAIKREISSKLTVEITGYTTKPSRYT